jgi:hypothetical protein
MMRAFDEVRDRDDVANALAAVRAKKAFDHALAPVTVCLSWVGM